jgi:adenylate cyclase
VGRAGDWLQSPQLELQGPPIPLDSDGCLPINFVGPPHTIPAVPFWQVLQAAKGVRRVEQDWKGATVLIGMMAHSQQDQYASPYLDLNRSLLELLRSFWSPHKPEMMSGVEIHANAVATLLDRAFITTPWWLSGLLLLIIVGAALGSVLVRLSLEAGLLVTFFHHWGWKLFALLCFRHATWRVEIVPMLILGVLLYGVIFTMRWRWIRRMLGMVKSEAVARALEASGGKLDLRGEEREITALFCDVRNFTSFSEKHSPHQVVSLLNALFAVVVPEVEAEGGTVNQYLGDGMMVIFGAPQVQPDHASRAVRAAVAMLRRVADCRDRWKELGADGFRIGIGIHTGKAVVGTVGSPRRLDYTAIGDTVNTASRIEAGNKELHTDLLISEATYLALPEEHRRQIPANGYRLLSAKGKQEPLRVYSLAAAGSQR